MLPLLGLAPLCGLAFALDPFSSPAIALAAELLQHTDHECLSTLQLRGEYRPKPGQAPWDSMSEKIWHQDLHHSPCAKTSSRPCIAGFRHPAECKRNFTYNGKAYSGCTKDGAEATGKLWCSRDSDHTFFSRFDTCPSCTEDSPKLPLQAWDVVAEKIRCLRLSMVVGSAKGVSYRFENNQDMLRKPFMITSAGKWPATVAIAGAVRDGFLDWDTRARDVFRWWLNLPGDSRSNVTLRNLLQFNSGFQSLLYNPHGELACMNEPLASHYSVEDCAQDIYRHAQHLYEPGRMFTYNGFHLVIAMAMAAERSGKTAVQLLNDNVFKAAGMNSTSVGGGENPQTDALMSSTGEDYARFLEKYLRYELLPKEICDVMETPAGAENYPYFAMGFAVNGNELWWGGTLFPHLNRAAGMYTVVVPKPEDYIAYLPLMSGAPIDAGGPEYIGAGSHAWEWIQADVERLGALDELSAL